MKTSILGVFFTLTLSTIVFAQEFKVITTVESLWMVGGESRILGHESALDPKPFTSESTDGRKDKVVKIEKFEETKLLNLYSFRDIATNDAVMSSKLTAMAKDGWALVFVNSGVRVDSGGTQDVLITRYIFRKD